MKKVIPAVLAYTFIVFIGCIIFSNFYGHIPVLLEGAAGHYKFTRAMLWFLTFLPAILISAYTMTFSVVWKKNTDNALVRFSHGMFIRYRNVLISALCFVFLLALNAEIFIPSAKNEIALLKSAFTEFEDAMSAARLLSDQDKPDIALQYAERAVNIAPENAEARKLYKEINDAVDIKRDRDRFNYKNNDYVNYNKPLAQKNAGYTTLELLKRSDEAAAKSQWFESHYWATLALQACSGTDSNLVRAREAANNAWNQLNKPVKFDNSAEAEYYRKKKEAYSEYNNNDNLKAYYDFLWLQENSINSKDDPDVERFLALAKENVENQYFFFDEIENMKILANNRNVYFKLANPDGSQDVFFMKATMDIKKTAGFVRYIQDFNVVHFSDENKFVYSMQVPFAKVVAVPVTTFTKEAQIALGIEKSWKYVPMIQLCSVDRKKSGTIVKPEFKYAAEGIPQSVCVMLGIDDSNEFVNGYAASVTGYSKPKDFKEFSMMILPMKFDDFKIINESSSGPEKMSIFELNKFLSKAVSYGFSVEVFNQNLVSRITFPLFILILFMIAAISAWNFRVEGEKSIFKFSWIFLYPVFTFIVYVLFEFLSYIFNMLNYVIVGMTGMAAMFVAFVIYAIIFVVVSIVFLSRKAS